MTTYLTKCVTLAVILTQASCYTFANPKMFGQSLAPSEISWSNIYHYPPRTYQPPFPLQLLRYYGADGYYPGHFQNRNYYYPQDTYDDSDYYSNFLYYLPSARSYFGQPPMSSIGALPEELPDYEDESTEGETISKPQRDWWLANDVAANEDIDLSQLNRVDNLRGSKSTVSKTEPKQNSKVSRPFVSKSRYNGIDGFGRKKDLEDGTYRPSTRKEERTSVYGKPVHHERNEDSNVRDLKSLLRMTPKIDDDKSSMSEDSASLISRWESGSDKRSAVKAYSMSEKKDNSAYTEGDESAKMNPWTATKPVNTFTTHDEGGLEVIPENRFDESKWKDYAPEQTSVFDTIKTLLALEDEVNEGNQDGRSHKLLKRKPPAYKPPVKNKSSNKDRSRNQGSTTEVIPKSKTPGESSPQITTNPTKGSAEAEVAMEGTKPKLYHSNEDTLVRELSAARRQNS